MAAIAVDGCRARACVLPRRLRDRLRARGWVGRLGTERREVFQRRRGRARGGHGHRRTSTGIGSTTTDDGDASGSGRDGDTTGDGGSGEGAGPKAPPPGTIAIDYGRWDGIFEIASPAMLPEFGLATVVAEFRYLGGVDCSIGLVRVRGWFFNGSGKRVGTGLWESVYSTREGGEVTGREQLPFEAYGTVTEVAESVALRVTAVECL